MNVFVLATCLVAGVPVTFVAASQDMYEKGCYVLY